MTRVIDKNFRSPEIITVIVIVLITQKKRVIISKVIQNFDKMIIAIGNYYYAKTMTYRKSNTITFFY